MFDRNSTIKVLAIAILVGVLALSVIGCQQSQTQGTSGAVNQGDNAKPVDASTPKVLFFSADY
ncbi:MAG TPA: hypothetical protein DE036_09530 [Actinobacteria bacterium]|nr:hypothetical protein [Actinomycetota bacterium]